MNNYERIKNMDMTQMAIRLSAVFDLILERIAIDNKLIIHNNPYRVGFWLYYLKSEEIEEVNE